MSVVNGLKVFELARELDKGPLDVVEDIKKMGFCVRNHMATLSQEDVNAIRNYYLQGMPNSSEIRKKVVRKRVLKSVGIIKHVPKLEEKAPNLRSDFLAMNREKEVQKRAVELQRAKENFLSDMEVLDLGAFYQKYHSANLLYKAEAYGVTLPQKIVDLYGILQRCSYVTQDDYRESISFENLPEERKKQFEFQLRENIKNGKDSDWSKKILKQSISAETAFHNLCGKRNIPCINLNVQNPKHEQDFLVMGTINIDVKSKAQVGSRMDSSLRKDYVAEGEKIAYFSCQSKNYDSDFTDCDLIGIYDPKIVPVSLAENTKEVPFYNPCMFVDFDSYFNCIQKADFPKILPEVASFFLKLESENSFNALVNYYGVKQVLMLDLVADLPKELHSIVSMLSQYSQKGELHLSCMLVFDWILKTIKFKEKLNIPLIKKTIFPLCFLNKYQKNYLDIMLKVSSAIPNFNCIHTGKSLVDCKITYNKGIIYANAGDEYASNTLMGYSWYDGRTISIDKDERCKCGCLVHDGRGVKIGKTSCLLYGKNKKRLNQDLEMPI